MFFFSIFGRFFYILLILFLQLLLQHHFQQHHFRLTFYRINWNQFRSTHQCLRRLFLYFSHFFLFAHSAAANFAPKSKKKERYVRFPTEIMQRRFLSIFLLLSSFIPFFLNVFRSNQNI